MKPYAIDHNTAKNGTRLTHSEATGTPSRLAPTFQL